MNDIARKTTLIESLRLIQLEKLLIISKEIDFIENILLYFKGYEEKESEKEKSFVYNNIERLEYDIDSIKIRVGNLTDINDNMLEFSEKLKFLLFYDYIQTQIEEMLTLLEGIYVKMNQLFGETLNQYLPYPTFFGRRFSSHGLMMYLDRYFEKLNEILSVGHIKENNMVLGWSYNTGFKHKILRNKNLWRENYNHETHNDYIELPYWYYELPLLIPAITHEVVRISLRSKKSKLYKEEYKNFEETILKFFKNKSNDLVQEIGNILGYEILTKDFIKDIFSDIVAFEIHGKAYFYTLFHNLIADGIAKDFLKIVYEDKEGEDKGKKIVKYEFRPNDWFFSLKRDHNHLRVYYLLYYWEERYSKYKDSSETIEIREILNTIMDLSEKKDKDSEVTVGFKKLFKENYPNYYTTYEVVENYLQQLYEYMTKEINKINIDLNENEEENSGKKSDETKTSSIKKYDSEFKSGKSDSVTNNTSNKKVCGETNDKNDNIKSNDNDSKETISIQSKYFNQLWEERIKLLKKENYKSVPYKGKFRQIIHNKISNIKYLDNNENLEISVLTLRKLRKDKVNKIQKISEEMYNEPNEKAPKEVFFNNIKELEDKDNHWRAYGIYDIAILEQKENTFNVYLELNNLFKEKEKKSIYYFDTKNILMKVADEIKGESLKSSNFGAIINIELKKSNNSKNGYNSLNGSIKSIKMCLGENKLNFIKANIYKSLGPKDLTIIVEGCCVDKVYEIIDRINKIGEINRTSSIIISSSNKELTIDNCSICSYIRIPKKDRGTLFENIKKELIGTTIYQTVGVMDYRIEWRKEKSIENIFNIYKNILPYITDYQTVIERKIENCKVSRKYNIQS